jgi:hypothetical protein
MPLIKNSAKRRNCGNQILGNTADHFDSNSEFVGRLGGQVIEIREFPHWYANFNKFTPVLVEMYKDLEHAVRWLNAIGIGAVGSAGGAGVAETIKSGSVKEGLKKTAGRLAGRGAVIEEIGKRAGLRIGPARAGVAGMAVAVAGTIYCAHAVETMEEIKKVLMDRHQKGDMTDEQFRRVFGPDVDPADVKDYWEM